MLPIIAYPAIDPVLLQIGPFAIRWYALSYITGLLLGWRYMLHLSRQTAGRPAGLAISAPVIDDFLLWVTLGVALGGRLGYVLFYKPGFYLSEPLQILYVWTGGMSFHGGLLGVLLAMLLFCRQRKIRFFAMADILACTVPIGLFLGRLANFINSELWGRPTDIPWAMVFPNGGLLPRHPSQLYEAGMEGILLFLLLWLVRRTVPASRSMGFLSGTFLIGYGCARIVAEFFREPDDFLGFLFAGATMGQLLSLPMVLFGVWLIWRANLTRPATPA